MLRSITVAMIQWYRRSLSKRKVRPCCRFYPTCSGYALTAVSEWGFWKGGALSLKRILKCNPWGKSGVDPVPVRHRTSIAHMNRSQEHRDGAMLLVMCHVKDKEQK